MHLRRLLERGKSSRHIYRRGGLIPAISNQPMDKLAGHEEQKIRDKPVDNPVERGVMGIESRTSAVRI